MAVSGGATEPDNSSTAGARPGRRDDLRVLEHRHGMQRVLRTREPPPRKPPRLDQHRRFSTGS
jgi:hypothetical protein